MSLTHRKGRPLVRDAQRLRDDRLFIVACDDTYAPKQYLNFLRLFLGCRYMWWRQRMVPQPHRTFLSGY